MPDGPILPSKLPAAHAKRLAWALKAHGHLLSVAVRKDTSPEARQVEKLLEELIPEHVGRIILERADPTMAKTMTGWLVKQYAQGGLRLEDTGTAHETLDMFQRYAPKLPEGQRDLGKYQSLAEAWQVVFPLAEAEQDKLSGKAQKAMERDKAYAESRILRQDPDGFTIAVPLTEFAAKWWGKGTRWCTAAEKDNQFGGYHEEAPLIVIVIPELKEKGKFQLWVSERDVQFMDAADEEVTKTLITKYFYRFDAIISFSLRQNGHGLANVPKKLRTVDLCRMAVAQNGWALEYVPERVRTEEMCRIAVAQNGGALGLVPEDLRSEEMCGFAVAQNGWALYDVPPKMCTDEICRIAVAQDGEALQYVPQHLRTGAMCRIAVAQNGWALKFVPQKLRTEEMCRIAVAQHGEALRYVPQKLRTEELCRIAIAQNGGALGHVPQKLRTEVMCRIAVAQYGEALGHVPQKLRKEAMCRIAVAQGGAGLWHVPDALRTVEMCRTAVARHGGALACVPNDLRTEEMCQLAVTNNGSALCYAPKLLRNAGICKIAVAQDGRALHHVPDALRSEMQQFVKAPQPSWDLAILDQLAEVMAPEHSLSLSGGMHA
jgi:hypothetical protein